MDNLLLMPAVAVTATILSTLTTKKLWNSL